MSYRKTLRGIVWSVLAVSLMLALTQPSIAQDAMGREDQTFEVGGSCAALAFITKAELRELTSTAYTDDFHSFCYPEEPAETCADYNSFLRGFGRLTVGDDGYHCSLQLHP